VYCPGCVSVVSLLKKEEMPEFDREKFNECWRSTEVIREYQRMLFTFGDMELPYVLVAEHSRFKDRAVVMKGLVFRDPT
jgi:hypothetical protein